MGQAYIPATARATNGIMALDVSSGGGQQMTGTWLYWTADGFTGHDWYWNDSDNGLKDAWIQHQYGSDAYVDKTTNVKYSADEAGLSSYVATHPTNLDELFAAWNDTWEKSRFIGNHGEELESYGCVSVAQ